LFKKDRKWTINALFVKVKPLALDYSLLEVDDDSALSKIFYTDWTLE
jgi:hypothetical protein